MLTNDSNPSDPDNNVFARIGLHDPPSLNGSTSVDVSGGGQVSLSNAAETPGGLRASVEVESTQFFGGFAVLDGVTAGTKVLPGETATSTTITFDRYGRLNGTYNGMVTVNMEMKSNLGFFINDPDPVTPRVYDLSYTLGTTSTDSVGIASGEDFGPGKVGVNNAIMAATLLGGTSSTNQTVSMTIGTNPETVSPSADLVGDPVDLSFGTPGDLYVLQFTYDQNSLPAGLSEADLIALVYDTGSSDWIEAIDLNSDGGVGATFFNGSFDEYLTSTDGTLDLADLSAFGIDAVNDQAWAVLDHNSLFGVGRLTVSSVPGDYNGDGMVNIADYTVWRDNLGGTFDLNGNGDESGGSAGVVDAADYMQWKTNFGTMPTALSAEPTVVPEPTSLGLILIALCSQLRRGRLG